MMTGVMDDARIVGPRMMHGCLGEGLDMDDGANDAWMMGGQQRCNDDWGHG